MKMSKTLWITMTALLIALILIIQVVTKAVGAPQLVTGSLVNFILIIGAGLFGFASAGVVAVLSALLAFFVGLTPGGNIAMVPVVMIGNLLIVLITSFAFKRSQKLQNFGRAALQIAGVIVGALIKFVAMWLLAGYVIIPLFVHQAKMAKIIGMATSYAQLITALIGGVIALLLLPVLKRALKGTRA